MRYKGKYEKRFYEWHYLGKWLWEVEDGRYVACQCWYENKKDGLKVKINPVCPTCGEDSN